MAASKKSYKYSVELTVDVVDAPGTRLTSKGDIYINICLLGLHKRTRLLPPQLPMHIHQTLHFDKVFKSCHDPRDIIQRLEREHVLIELLQADGASPVLLASYETSAKDFVYPHTIDRVQFVGLRRNILLSRTIDFPGVSPSLEFIASPSIDDNIRIGTAKKPRKPTKPISSYGRNPRPSRLPTWKPSSTYPNRSSLYNSNNVSRSLTSHTISSAVKNDYGQRETKDKLRELAIAVEVKDVKPIDKTAGRRPFVVRHVDDALIGRHHNSHLVLNEGLVVNDYSLSRGESATSLRSLNDGSNRSRSVSPGNNRNYNPTKARSRSPSPSRRSVRTSQSVDFERRERSQTPPQRRSPTKQSYANENYHNGNDEYHSTKDCAICRLHHIHSEQSQRAKSLEQQQFTTTSKRKLYSPDIYSTSPARPVTSATLLRDSFSYRHGRSPANDLSDKIIGTLRHNLDSYSAQPWHQYYSSFRYSDGHADDDELLERSRRLTQD